MSCPTSCSHGKLQGAFSQVKVAAGCGFSWTLVAMRVTSGGPQEGRTSTSEPEPHRAGRLRGIFLFRVFAQLQYRVLSLETTSRRVRNKAQPRWSCSDSSSRPHLHLRREVWGKASWKRPSKNALAQSNVQIFVSFCFITRSLTYVLWMVESYSRLSFSFRRSAGVPRRSHAVFVAKHSVWHLGNAQ